MFFYILQAIMQFCWTALTASVDVADGVVFIVACSEGGTDAGTVLSVFCGVIGNISDAGNADALTVIEPFFATGYLNYLWNQYCDQ
jgi:hypothetical protein